MISLPGKHLTLSTKATGGTLRLRVGLVQPAGAAVLLRSLQQVQQLQLLQLLQQPLKRRVRGKWQQHCSRQTLTRPHLLRLGIGLSWAVLLLGFLWPAAAEFLLWLLLLLQGSREQQKRGSRKVPARRSCRGLATPSSQQQLLLLQDLLLLSWPQSPPVPPLSLRPKSCTGPLPFPAGLRGSLCKILKWCCCSAAAARIPRRKQRGGPPRARQPAALL